MRAEFQFNYGEKEYTFAVKDGEVYEMEKGVTVTAVAKEYKEFDALEWVLYFENKSGKDSKVFSDICDCNILLPLNYPRAHRNGYRAIEGDACVITMNGMVEGAVKG